MQKSGLIEKAFILKKTAIFAGIDLDLLLSLADKASLRFYEAGELIFSHNQEANRFYILSEGSVALFCPDNRPLSEMRPYEFFGEEALFSDRPRSYSATALQESHLLSINKGHLFSFMNECPSSLFQLMQIWAHRLPSPVQR